MQNPEAKLLVVVGNSHRKGVEETINNPAYRTEVDTELIEAFKDSIELLK